MTTVNNTELSRYIKGYLAYPKCQRPFILAGTPGTGRHRIFSHTLRSVGLESIPFWTVMKLKCGGENMVAFSKCDDESRFHFDYHLACDFVERTGRPVVLITDIDNLDEVKMEFVQDSVNYKLTLDDWISWGHENVAPACKEKRTRLNVDVMEFLYFHPEYFMTPTGYSAKQWRTISDRWNMIERLSWIKNLNCDEQLSLHIAALKEYSEDSNESVEFEVAKYLHNRLCLP